MAWGHRLRCAREGLRLIEQMITDEPSRQLPAAATHAAARSRGCGWTARAGSEVNTTQMVWLAGSAQAIVPVEPVWPNVFSEHPLLPADAPTLNPKPREVSPSRLWLVTMSLAVCGFTAAPFSLRNSPKKRAMSGAEACVPPQGAPSFRQ